MKQYSFISSLSQDLAQRDLQITVYTVMEQLLHCCMVNMLHKAEKWFFFVFSSRIEDIPFLVES